MKRTALVLATIGVLALACGEADGPEDAVAMATTNPGLAEPWNSMGLPVGPAEVIVADKTVALLLYDGHDFNQLGAAWESTWSELGWAQTDKFTDDQFVAAIYAKDGKEIGWALGSDAGAVLVYLEDLSLIPPEASTVRQAKTGTRQITKTTRPTSTGSGKTALPKAGSSSGGAGALPKAGSGGSTGGSGGAALPRGGGSGSTSGGSGGGSSSGSGSGGKLPR